jgi:hypothetical protein
MVMLATVLTAGTAASQTNNSWFEQWFRAKHGRNSPSEEARLRREAANTAYRDAGQTTAAQPSWFEKWFRAKYGRLAPSEQARRDAEAANTAYRDSTPDADSRQAEVQYRDAFKAKYGRELPKSGRSTRKTP